MTETGPEKPNKIIDLSIVETEIHGKKVRLPNLILRAIIVSLELKRGFFRKRPEIANDPKKFEGFQKTRTLDKESLTNEIFNNWNLLFNCHIFFILGLGYNLKLKSIREAFFEKICFSLPFVKEEPTTVNNIKDLLKLVEKKFDEYSNDTDIICAQITNNEDKITHSFFIIKIGEEFFIAAKNGYEGFGKFIKLEEEFGDRYFSNANADSYGNNFNFGSWVDLATDPKIQKLITDINKALR